MSEMTPWSPASIRRAVEEHHWPPPTLWIRDMLDGIASAWEADRKRLREAQALLGRGIEGWDCQCDLREILRQNGEDLPGKCWGCAVKAALAAEKKQKPGLEERNG